MTTRWPGTNKNIAAPTGFNYPHSGLNNVAEYIASGLPYVTQSTAVTSSVTKIDFPFVTNFFTIKNNGAGTLAVGFTENGVQGTNKFTLVASGSNTAVLRIKSLFVTAEDSNTTFELIVGLTQIPSRGFPILTGSAAGYNTGSVAFEYGYDGIG